MYIYLLSRQSAVPGSVGFGCGGSAVGSLGRTHRVHSQDSALWLSFPLLSAAAMGPAPAPAHCVRALWASFSLFGTGSALPLGNCVIQTVLCCGVGEAGCALQKRGGFQGLVRHGSIDMQTPIQAI